MLVFSGVSVCVKKRQAWSAPGGDKKYQVELPWPPEAKAARLHTFLPPQGALPEGGRDFFDFFLKMDFLTISIGDAKKQKIIGFSMNSPIDSFKPFLKSNPPLLLKNPYSDMLKKLFILIRSLRGSRKPIGLESKLKKIAKTVGLLYTNRPKNRILLMLCKTWNRWQRLQVQKAKSASSSKPAPTPAGSGQSPPAS